MTTVANIKSSQDAHWYTQNGEPCHQMPKKSEPGAFRATTLADARKLQLLPSVTTILKVLHKEALVAWRIEQAVLAVVTAPRLQGEPDDQFIERVLKTEKQQDQERDIARDIGTRIHDALECYFTGQPVDPEMRPWIEPAANSIRQYGTLAATERVLVGEGYAGRTDLIMQAENGEDWWLWDYKTTKKLPDPTKGGAWQEHQLQAAAYARAWLRTLNSPESVVVRTGNVYISSVDQGKFVICEHDDWHPTFNDGFAPLVRHWQWSTGYTPLRLA